MARYFIGYSAYTRQYYYYYFYYLFSTLHIFNLLVVEPSTQQVTDTISRQGFKMPIQKDFHLFIIKHIFSYTYDIYIYIYIHRPLED